MPDIVPLPPDYAAWLAELKAHIYAAQQPAARAVNRELLLLHWQIGRDILARQERAGWGAKVIEWLAQELRNAFPDMKGFSSRNLKYMRSFAEAWPKPNLCNKLLHKSAAVSATPDLAVVASGFVQATPAQLSFLANCPTGCWTNGTHL